MEKSREEAFKICVSGSRKKIKIVIIIFPII